MTRASSPADQWRDETEGGAVLHLTAGGALFLTSAPKGAALAVACWVRGGRHHSTAQWAQ